MGLSKMNQLAAVLGAACICLGLLGPAHAQVTQTFTSLEALVAEAEDVVRGPIVTVSRDVKIPKNGKRSDGTEWPDGLVEYTFTVRIDETLKGKKAGEVELIRTTSAYDMSYVRWREAKTEFLWFLGQRDEYSNTTHSDRDRKWGALRLGNPLPDALYYKSHAPPIFAMDFRVLKDHDEILAATRHAAKILARSSRKPIKFVTIDIPGDVAQQCRPSADRNFFKVPVSEELEPIARKMITAPHKFGSDFVPSPSSQKMLCLGGVELLGNFKSDENAALLAALLEDPFSFVTKLDEHGKPLKHAVRRFVIRAAAYEVLQRWQTKVAKPIVQETLKSEDNERDGTSIDSVGG